MDDLVQRAQRGESAAFIELMERNKRPLWSAAIAVLDNVEDAADALQEATIKAWRCIPRFEGRSSIGTWLMRILLRTCYDTLRKRSHETPFAWGGASPEAGSLLDPLRDEFRVIAGSRHPADRDEALDVRSAVGKLSVDDRLLLALFYVDDYPIQHIASILNVSEGAIRTRLSRARSRFKDIYSGECEENREAAQ